MNILWGLLGILAIFAIAFLLSEHKSKINIRTILIGLAIQLLFGFIVLKWETGGKRFFGLQKPFSISSIMRMKASAFSSGLSYK